MASFVKTCEYFEVLLGFKSFYDEKAAEPAEGYAYRLQKRLKKATDNSLPLYCDLSFVPCGTVSVERLFSQAKLVLREQRNRLAPKTLECLLFLKANRDFWDLKTVSEALNRIEKWPAESSSSEEGSD